MRPRNTLILLGTAAVLVLFIVIFEAATPSTDELLESAKLAFPDFRKDRNRADAIEIIRGGAKTVFVKRDVGTSEEHWYLTQPIECRADNSRIVGLLGALERAEKFEVGEGRRSIPVAPTTNLANYGLDQDSAIRLRIAAGEEALIDAFIGAKTAGTERVYVMPAERGRESEVYVVAETVRETVTHRLDEYRDKRLLDLHAGVVTQLTVFENGKPVYELAREKEGPWRMITPVADRADQVIAGEIAEEMGSLWADVFHQDFEVNDPEMPKKLAELELKPARRSVKLTLDVDGDIRQHEVLLGRKLRKKTGPETSWNVYAMVAGSRTVVHLPDDVIETIDVKIDSLRDHRVFTFEAADAERLFIDRPFGPIHLEKTGDGDWKLTRPERHEADSRGVKELLDELAALRVAKFLPSDTKLEDPIRVEVGLAAEDDEGEGGSEVVFFGGAEAGPARARRGPVGRSGGAVFEIPGAVLEKLGAVKYRFWDRTVLKFEHDDIRRITLTCGERTETAVAQAVGREDVGDEDAKERREWKLAGGGEVDVGAADKIKWDLSDLEAEELLGPTEDASLGAYGLDAPALRVEITLEAGEGEDEETHVLRVGSLAKPRAGAAGTGIRKLYAKFEDDPMVFLLREAVVKRFRKGLARAEKADE